jgi:hypothetical protein
LDRHVFTRVQWPPRWIGYGKIKYTVFNQAI